MTKVIIKDGETIEQAIARFKKKCSNAGIMSDARKKEHYEKPSVKRKKKSAEARKRKTK